MYNNLGEEIENRYLEEKNRLQLVRNRVGGEIEELGEKIKKNK